MGTGTREFSCTTAGSMDESTIKLLREEVDVLSNCSFSDNVCSFQVYLTPKGLQITSYSNTMDDLRIDMGCWEEGCMIGALCTAYGLVHSQ